MAVHPQTCRDDGTLPTSPRSLHDPLDFLSQDHMRARQVCAMIDRLAAAPDPDSGDAEAILTFLGEEFRDHVADEEQVLYPMLLSRCRSEDEIWKAIERVSEDRGDSVAALADLRLRLRPLLAGGALSEDDRAALRAFAARARRYIIAENAIILPLARARLSPGDLAELQEAMRARRSWPLPKGARDA